MNLLASKIICAIKEIDHEQTEGGIYALPDRYSKGKWPASHHHLFGGHFQELDLCSRLGLRGKEHSSSKRINFIAEEGSGYVQFTDIALTKVRPYGNSFQLDRHHGKKWEDCSTDLKKAVSRFLKGHRNYGLRDCGILVAIIFTDSEKHASDLIKPSTAESFLNRYGLTQAHETWADPHGRGIWTSVACWIAQPSRT